MLTLSRLLGRQLSLRVKLLIGRRTSSNVANSNNVCLRLYQESCLQTCLDALSSGATRIGVSLPTGSGKTTIFVSLISRLRSPIECSDANRAIIIVNSIELARQSAEQVKRLHPHLSVEIEQGVKHKATGEADVTVATYQTLLREERIGKFNPEKLKCIVVDEAHHAAAPSYRRILAHFDPNIRHPDVDFERPNLGHRIPIVGFSATFSRHDGLALGSVFERIVYHRHFLDMIKEEWLCNIRFTSVKAQLNLNEVTINTHSGEFNPTSLAHVINTESINRLVVQSWLDRASQRKSTLVFCVNLAHLSALTQAFRDAGVDARYVYAGTPAKERKDLIDAFRCGEFPVLLNVAILTEGTDIPNIDCVVIAKPTRSRNIYAQMIGRGMRLSPQTGKTDCHVVDFVDSTSRVSGVISTPSLFGLDPDEVIEDETPESLEERAEKSIAVGKSGGYDADDIPDPTSVTYIDYENPFELAKDASGAPHINQMSKFAWVGCGNDVYVLECLGKGYVRIEPETDDEGQRYFVARYTAAAEAWQVASNFRKSRFNRPRKVLTAGTLDEAVRGCDTYVVKKVAFGGLALGLHRSARWRKTPATEGQKAIISKRFEARPVDGLFGGSFDVSTLTKGQAANIITRLKHGAQVRYSKKVKLAMKEALAADKERRRRAREQVSVGPLSTGEFDNAVARN